MGKRLLVSGLILSALVVSPISALASTDSVAPVVVAVEKPKKEPWRKRHPKMHKVACTTRNVCLFVAPVIDVAGKVIVGVGLLIH